MIVIAVNDQRQEVRVVIDETKEKAKVRVEITVEVEVEIEIETKKDINQGIEVNLEVIVVVIVGQGIKKTGQDVDTPQKIGITEVKARIVIIGAVVAVVEAIEVKDMEAHIIAQNTTADTE